MADYNNDGKDDVALGREQPSHTTTVPWYVMLSNGNKFGSIAKWKTDFGNLGDTWLEGNFKTNSYPSILLKRQNNNAITLYLQTSTGSTFSNWLKLAESINHPNLLYKAMRFDTYTTKESLDDLLEIDFNTKHGRILIMTNQH